jgi:hypothetical protein
MRSIDGGLLGNDFIFRFRTQDLVSAQAKAKGGSKKGLVSYRIAPAEFRTSSVMPGRNQAGVGTGQKIMVTFTHQLDMETVNQNSVRVFDAHNRQVRGELYAPPGDLSLSLTPYKPLAEGELYRVVLDAKLSCTHHEKLPSPDTFWSFKTIWKRAFSVIAVGPQVLTDPHGAITIRLSRAVDARTLSRGASSLRGGGMSFPGKLTIAQKGEVLRFTPYESLPDHQVFTLLARPISPGRTF